MNLMGMAIASQQNERIEKRKRKLMLIKTISQLSNSKALSNFVNFTVIKTDLLLDVKTGNFSYRIIEDKPILLNSMLFKEISPRTVSLRKGKYRVLPKHVQVDWNLYDEASDIKDTQTMAGLLKDTIEVYKNLEFIQIQDLDGHYYLGYITV